MHRLVFAILSFVLAAGNLVLGFAAWDVFYFLLAIAWTVIGFAWVNIYQTWKSLYGNR